MPATKTRKPQLTDEERAQKDSERLAKLNAALELLRTSEGWMKWLKTRKRFHRYSFNNQLLIAAQAPDAKHVAGFRAWLDLGFCVRKGETAISIMAPRTIKDKDDETKRKMVGVKWAAVFHDGQVDPLPGKEQANLDPPPTKLEGEGDHQAAYDQLAGGLIHDNHVVDVTVGPTLPAGGWHAPGPRVIRVGEHLTDPLLKLRVLIHEGAHAITHPLGITYELVGRGRCERIVEAATFLVLDGLGFDNTKSTAYIEGWGQDDPSDIIAKDAAIILSTAKIIESYLEPGKEEAAE